MWRGVRFQKSVSGKHAFRGKHGSLARDMCAGTKHASLGICVQETRYPGNIYHCDSGINFGLTSLCTFVYKCIIAIIIGSGY